FEKILGCFAKASEKESPLSKSFRTFSKTNSSFLFLHCLIIKSKALIIGTPDSMASDSRTVKEYLSRGMTSEKICRIFISIFYIAVHGAGEGQKVFSLAPQAKWIKQIITRNFLYQAIFFIGVYFFGMWVCFQTDVGLMVDNLPLLI
ncbi:MAG: hypothetical protein SV375_13305, partial [Thermodesulfobacteriota bacterium]|nr:hypothetical protein [Thermodesulfobacteriota bacterium]